MKNRVEQKKETNELFIVACIPAYNEERTVASVILETEKYVDKIIVVDDGSEDKTAEIASRMGATVVSHKENKGYGAALMTGFSKALELGADVIVTLDADGQHDPSYIPQLVKLIAEGKADVVIGSRFLGKAKMPKYRRLGVKAITKLSNIVTKLKVTDAQSGFRAYSKRAIKEILPMLNERGMGLSLQILNVIAEKKFKVAEVPIVINYNVEEPSAKNPLAHGLELLATLIKNVTERRPLFYLGVPGATFIGIGAFFVIYLLWMFNLTGRFSLLSAIIATGSLLTGLLLVTTALILHTIKNVTCRRKTIQ